MQGAIRAEAFGFLICLAMVHGLASTTLAQSKPRSSLIGFSVPAPHLRSDLNETPLLAADPPPHSAPDPGGRHGVSNLHATRFPTFEVSPALAWEELQLQRLWVEQDRSRALRDAQSPIVRYLSTTFEPVPVRLRRATFSCSLWTAIKRGNPLSLLNPIFLNLTW